MKLRQIIPSQRYRGSLKRGTRLQMWKRAHGKCWYCGERISKNAFVLDHQVAFVHGGADSARNLVVSCKPCDRRKGMMTLDQFRAHEQVSAFYGESV